MTFRKPFFYVFFFLFLLLPTSTYAYETFNQNAFYDSDILGSYHTYNNNLNAYWNATCNGKTGCLILANNGTDTINRIFITNTTGTASYFTSDWTNITYFLYNVIGSNEFINVPKGKVGIIALRYYWNDTPSTNTLPQMIFQNFNTGVISGMTLSTTPNVWHTATFALNASTDVSFTPYGILLFYELADTPEHLAIDKFQFYTLDVNEIRTDFTSNKTYELIKYCGVNSSVRSDNTYWGAWYGGTCTGQEYCGFFNDTAFLFGIDDNGIDCGFVKTGNKIFARRWSYAVQPLNTLMSYNTNNLFFEANYYSNIFISFYETLIRTQTKMNVIYLGNTSPGGCIACDDSQIRYNDVLATNISVYSFELNYSTALSQTINLTGNPSVFITNQNPSGTGFRYCTYNACSPLIPFFSTFFSADNTGWYCSDVTNQEGYILPNGTEINTLYCGDVGCNAEHTHCNFGFIGTYCSDNTHWIYSDVSGAQNTGFCSYRCVNITNGIQCLDNANVSQECIGNNGQLIDCNTLNQNNTQTVINNCLASGNYYCSTALSLTSFIGVTDKGLSESFLSLIVSFIISVSVLYLGRKSKAGMEGFLVSMFAFLTGFTLIGLFNPIAWVLCIILDGYLIYQMIMGGKH